MTIDEAIKEINWSIKVHKKILETDAKELDVDSAWVKHWKSVVEAFDIAIDTMRKYQKFQDQSLSLYMERLNADMVAMLTEIQLEIEEIPNSYEHKPIGTYDYCSGAENERKVNLEIIQQKINALKEDGSEEE